MPIVWDVDGMGAGSLALGTLSATTGDNTAYTAPGAVPSANPVPVNATIAVSGGATVRWLDSRATLAYSVYWNITQSFIQSQHLGASSSSRTTISRTTRQMNAFAQSIGAR